MKKLSFLILAAVLVAGSSCKKDRTCECTDSTGAVVGSVTIHDTKSKAKTACDANNNNNSGVTCTIK